MTSRGADAGSPDPEGAGRETSAEQKLRDAARALADAAGKLGQSLGAAGSAQAEQGVAKGLLAAAEALAQAKSWVEERARPLSTREQLLRRAGELFAERGYSGVSLEDIAQAAGFTKGAVYTHFGSKEQVFLAAVRDVAERVEAQLGSGPDAGAPLSAQEIASATRLTTEAILFATRHPEHLAEMRPLVFRLIQALPNAERDRAQHAEASDPEIASGRVLSPGEGAFAELALRVLLGGLGAAPAAGDPVTE
ncbi:TetR/AcrR family transcriptional regulator [Leucobacter sp. M11]|uniref:TetR/AcrR family transcriptional regulator n=1 Tax=Leucobacter sp. M11 TaxID=2993565 RepID=UPI002D7FBB4F|nr:TetR family transcriptional regulator [Leucobacter sp. M11]MEB4615675.1 TetR family transcriptional regulator [Leucobacter sp. M11]